MEDRYTFDTPESIDLSFDVAGIGSRFMAALIDTLLLLFLQAALGLLAVVVATRLENVDISSSVVLAIWSLASFLFLWGYYLIFELVWNGQTPGKRAVGLRTVREGGRPINLVASALRNLVRVIDFLPGFYGLGVLAMFIDKRSRRLGDLVAGTLVVKERKNVTLDTLTGQAPPLPLPPRPLDAPAAPLLPNLQLIKTEDYDLVQDFLRRRGELGPESRQRLGYQLAERMRQRLGLPSGGEPELFLEHLVREYRVFSENRA
jgi:uncharacterized RDD family membrane protein YckC